MVVRPIVAHKDLDLNDSLAALQHVVKALALIVPPSLAPFTNN